MPFASLSGPQKIMVLLTLGGAPRYISGMTAAAGATTTLGRATAASGLAMRTAARRTYLMNQALFTLHRYAFLATTVIIGLGAGLLKLGISYNSALDQARAALGPLFKDQRALNDELQLLFKISKFSPFVLSDMTNAFRKMFPAFRETGMSIGTINKLVQAMVDTLSFAGRTTPAALQQISYAFQHMFFQGRLTGRLLQQLANAGVNVTRIRRLLGIQGQNISNIARLNISPETFTKAFLQVSGEKGVAGAAQRLALQSFAGSLQVARDSLSQFIGIFIGPAYKGAKSKLIELVGPGGPLDKLINIQQTRGNKPAIFAFSQMISGGSGLAKGLLFLGKLIKDLGNFFIHIWIPAVVQGAKILIVFYPALKLVDTILVALNRHTRVAKFLFTLLAAAAFLAYGRMLLLWLGSNLVRIALFNIVTVMKVHLIPLLIEYFGAQLAALTATIALWWSLVAAEYAAAGGINALKFAIFTFPIIGWILFALTLIVTLYFKWKWFHDKVNALIMGIGHFIIKYLINPIKWLLDHLEKAAGGGIFGGLLRNVVKETFGLHFLAEGGTMPVSGPAVVGERGPELLNLPKGSRVTSLTTRPIGISSILPTGDDRPIIVQLHVSRRVLAEEVARANQDKIARR